MLTSKKKVITSNLTSICCVYTEKMVKHASWRPVLRSVENWGANGYFSNNFADFLNSISRVLSKTNHLNCFKYLQHCYFGWQCKKVFGKKFSLYREGSRSFLDLILWYRDIEKILVQKLYSTLCQNNSVLGNFMKRLCNF